MQVMVTLSEALTICWGLLGNMIPLFLFNSLARPWLKSKINTEIRATNSRWNKLKCFTIFNGRRNNIRLGSSKWESCSMTSSAPHKVDSPFLRDTALNKNSRKSKESWMATRVIGGASTVVSFLFVLVLHTICICPVLFSSRIINAIRAGQKQENPEGNQTCYRWLYVAFQNSKNKILEFNVG